MLSWGDHTKKTDANKEGEREWDAHATEVNSFTELSPLLWSSIVHPTLNDHKSVIKKKKK